MSSDTASRLESEGRATIARLLAVLAQDSDPDQVESAYLAVLVTRLEAATVKLVDAVETATADLVSLLRLPAGELVPWTSQPARAVAARRLERIEALSWAAMSAKAYDRPSPGDIPAMLAALANVDGVLADLGG